MRCEDNGVRVLGAPVRAYIYGISGSDPEYKIDRQPSDSVQIEHRHSIAALASDLENVPK